MQLVLNHLTRMRTDERICIAGIDPDTRRHVRPVTQRTDLLTRDLLGENGGPLEVGALVDVGEPTPVPDPPETEDHEIETRDLRHIRVLDDDEYLEALDAAAAPDLESAFGSELQRRKWKYAIDVGVGRASLGVVKAQHRPHLEVGQYRKLQLQFNDPDIPAYLSVSDIRFVEADHETIRREIVDEVETRLRRGVGLYVMFGLSRAFRAIGDDQERHWLQVNGLCLEDRPTGGRP